MGSKLFLLTFATFFKIISMFYLIIIAFVVGYLFIALEHNVHIDKTASALLTGVVCWVLLTLGLTELLPEIAASHGLHGILLEHVGEIAEILFFLMGAMTIVELIDVHHGFSVITDKITTLNKVKLLWIISIITFFLSAALDNLTTAIVMAALLRKLIKKQEDLWFFGGMVIIAANAGGAWSPIGDVTTIMLWIGGQITAAKVISGVFLPSIVCLLVPLVYLTITQKGNVEPTITNSANTGAIKVSKGEQQLIFWLGVGGLLFVPIFKNLTHLPPFMGMLGSLGVLWITTELLHRKKKDEDKAELMVAKVLKRIDTPSVLFFLGILLAVAALQTGGHLQMLANTLDKTFGDIFIVNTLIGVLSSIVDNVPLVAGAMGMYTMETYAQDHTFWQLLAYCAGTGGSILIIGSAAGVAIMGLLKINFIWYLKRISLLALSGYLAGVGIMYLLHG